MAKTAKLIITQTHTLAEIVRILHKHYGPPQSLPSSSPFELILWENVAYLASPARRREAFELLTRTVGTAPHEIYCAGTDALERVTGKGILKTRFAEKLRECARLALEEFDGNLDESIRASPANAKRNLQRFPGIGEPGAEKILLFAGLSLGLAPESNGLRVLTRVGLVPETRSYGKTYAGARAPGATLAGSFEISQTAHLLLQEHGLSLCKRAAPRCNQCPLAGGCAYGQKIGTNAS